jgi:hypothetical protein
VSRDGRVELLQTFECNLDFERVVDADGRAVRPTVIEDVRRESDHL